ncbi:MAG: cell division protein ZapD [Gammaproteobacteria bacterium CG11_big_fil_rev_8_21_14_0_20_46_22]|nr:MAG: cell division protein ZapD [Gammaproteobacteria bacterium CG12_big_fil_rev_8_21_14_0_65_46_12]PIR11241.1 MAG: cell division protein ZapD [Gammaproteobacteria bacterium CG11_big_fil_rev_8_21_14_0_20_46_22]
MMQNTLTFEHPTSELTRVCLRLEYLFSTISENLAHFNERNAQYTMQLLIEIVCVLDRPDLKSKFTKELLRFSDSLKRLSGSPGVEEETLGVSLKALDQHLSYLSTCSGKLGKELAENEFLSMIRSNLNTAGNGSCSDMPAYFYWLSMDSESQTKQIKTWLSQLKPIEAIVSFILSIIRGSGNEKSVIADSGFYHENLSTSPACQLLRVTVGKSLNVYPEISAGKHRFTLRFLTANRSRPIQSHHAIEFELSICAI